jgi:hypothetical protein
MTLNSERRNFIAGVGAAAASTAVLATSRALAQTNPPTGSKAMSYQAKPMPFDPKSISGISEKVLVSHYENNYVGAVKRLNAIGTQLAELDFAKAPNFLINGLKREELIASNSMILHEIYFDGLGGASKTKRRARRCNHTRFRKHGALAGRIFGHGKGRGRRLRLGHSLLLAARQAARQSMGGRPYDDPCRRPSCPGARHV